MLVLSRKVQQQILIPDLNIRITVLSVGTNRVQLGIEAPEGIQITRPEILRPVPAIRIVQRPAVLEVSQNPC